MSRKMVHDIGHQKGAVIELCDDCRSKVPCDIVLSDQTTAPVPYQIILRLVDMSAKMAGDHKKRHQNPPKHHFLRKPAYISGHVR